MNLIEKILKEGNQNKIKSVYHGSNNKFTNFDFKKIGISSGNFGHYGHGMYFSDEILEAKTYGKIIYECDLEFKNPYTYKTPLHFITDLGNLSKELTIELKKLGYDSVIYGSEYVAFYPEQIFIKKVFTV